MATTSTTAVTVMMIFFLFCFFIPGTSLLLLVVSTELPVQNVVDLVGTLGNGKLVGDHEDGHALVTEPPEYP